MFQLIKKPRQYSLPYPRCQRGVALITVLLVFALAAIITSEVASRNFRDIRKTANLINSKQAYHYALAGEQLARQLLARDFIKDAAADTLVDNWANINQLFDIDNGAMTIEIHDLQGRFNINNLMDNDSRVNSNALLQFRRLQTILALSTDYSSVLIDWMDSNQTPMQQGAEDLFYQSLNYLPANQGLSDRSELRLLGEMDPADYTKLRDYVVALPKYVDDQEYTETKYNVNTLNANIVKAVLPAISSSQLSIIEQRQLSGGYSSLANWKNSLPAVRVNTGSDFDVRSEFFEVIVKVVYAERNSIVRSQLHRSNKDGSITIIKRQQGTE